MSKVNPSEKKDKQTAPGQVLTERLNSQFRIELSILPANEGPGPAWLDVYESEYLQVIESGYSNDFQGNQSFWVEFNPIKVGQAQVEFAQQPRLINPLFIGHPYTVNIIEG
jgi:hypothetical protein